MALLLDLLVTGQTRLNDDTYAKNIYADKFIRTGSSDLYVLLGGGGHKLLSDFSMAHSHPYLPLSGGTMTGSIVMNTGNYIYGINEGYGAMLFFDGSRTVIGSVGSSSTASTHIRTKDAVLTVGADNTASYTVLHSGNSSISGGGSTWGSYITVKMNGTSKTLTIPGNPNTDYRVTQTVTSSSNTSWRPILLGMSYNDSDPFTPTTLTDSVYSSHKIKVKPVTGDIFTYGSITSNSEITLLNAQYGDSPHLVFQRGLQNDGTYDWDFYVTDGYFKVRYNDSTWHDVLDMYPNNISTSWSITSTGGFIGNASSATKDSEGNVIKSTYLKLSGGTMTGNITFNGDIGVYGTNCGGKGILSSLSSSNTWDGVANYSCVVVGAITSPVVIRTSSDNLQHYNAAKGERYTILNSNNYISYAATKGHGHDGSYVKVLGAGSYNPLGAYVRPIYVDGSGYDFLSPYSTDSISITTTNVTQIVSTSGNTDFRPILVSGVTSTSSVTTPSFSTGTGTVLSAVRLYMQPSTGNLYLYNPDGGDSPSLHFQRAAQNDGIYDWDMYVKDGGIFKIRYNDGSWHDVFSMSPNNIYTSWSITSDIGFVKSGSSNDYALMGGGGHKNISNVQNTAFYKRVVTVNGSGWDMAGTNSNTAFIIYSPTTAGTSGQILKSTGGTPTWMNQSDITAGKVSCPATSSNYDRPLVGTPGDNALYHTTKATVNWSTGRINCGGVTFTDNTGGSSFIRYASNNVDTKIFRVYSSDHTYAESATFGFDLTYTGSGSGNENKLVLRADNQTGQQVNVFTAYQDGNVTFSKTPKVGSTSVSLSNHGHDGSYVKVLGAGSYNPLGAYVRPIYVNGSGFDFLSPYTSNPIYINTNNVLQTISTSDNTNFRPLLLGDSSSSSVTPTFSTITSSTIATARIFVKPSTGDLHLFNPDGGDSPFLYFQRGDLNTGSTFDWRMYVSSGNFYVQHDYGGWTNALSITYDNNATFANKVYATEFVGNLSGNASSSSVASSVVCSASTSNTDRPILVTNESNGLYYTTKVKLNYNTGVISSGGLSTPGNVVLHNTSGGDSPHLHFQRAAQNDSTYDWDMYVKDGGIFKIRYNNTSWYDVISMSTSGVTSAWQITAPAFYESSDERLKDFYNSIDVDLDKLSSLPKKFFKWKSNPNGEFEIGTSAQELQKIYPQLVNTDDKGYLTVAYDKLSIIALRAIDKLYEMNKNLERRIQILESKL